MIILCDLDGVLADCRHRLKYINYGRNDFKKFYEYNQVIRDSVIPQGYKLLKNQIENGNKLIFLSSRMESARKATEDWLKLIEMPYTKVMLRKNRDKRPSPMVKLEMVNKVFPKKPTQILFIDNDQNNIEVIEKFFPEITCTLFESGLDHIEKLL